MTTLTISDTSAVALADGNAIEVQDAGGNALLDITSDSKNVYLLLKPPVVTPPATPPISLTSQATGTGLFGQAGVGTVNVTLPSANEGDLLVAFASADPVSGMGNAPAVVRLFQSTPSLTWTNIGKVSTTVYPAQTLEVWIARAPSALTNFALGVSFGGGNGTVVWLGAFSHVDQTNPLENSASPFFSTYGTQINATPVFPVLTSIPCSATGLILAGDASQNAPVPSPYAPFSSLASDHAGLSGLNVADYAPGAAATFTSIFTPTPQYASAAVVLKNG
jgi:hypothetical protein